MSEKLVIVNPLRPEDLKPNAWEREQIRQLYQWAKDSERTDLRIKSPSDP